MTTARPAGRTPAENGTIYWTLSFYISADKLSAYAPGLKDPSAEIVASLSDALNNSYSPADARVESIIERTKALRQAIDPLFNDVADRSRLGKVEDFLFAGRDARPVTLTMPKQIKWTTEGKSFVVDLSANRKDRERSFEFRSFWYAHGNGGVSWHVSLWHCYKAALKSELKGGVPVSFYLMSLLQKLAWPKEFDPQSCQEQPCTTDRLVNVDIDGEAFWNFIESEFDADANLVLPMLFRKLGWGPSREKTKLFDTLVPAVPSIEVPGLNYRDNRSSFFIHDKEFFDLIQPKRGGALVGRGTRILDRNFVGYPRLLEDVRSDRGAHRHLNQTYWSAVHGAGAGSTRRSSRDRTGEPATSHRTSLPNAAQRLTYLFLAGFNQNIIDFMNQEASEILDSLDPIYPRSGEQEEEGFFIRYANPRSMITYVPRSRTLEVGNDFIGTCPYAFLIHALSMHNEALTRDHEKSTFEAIKAVMKAIDTAEKLNAKNDDTPERVRLWRARLAPIRPVIFLGRSLAALGAMLAASIWRWLQSWRGHASLPLEPAKDVNYHLALAEASINETRINAFRKYDQHRYANPFRYDTERDVFEAMEQLRGTSRLREAYRAALDALDEQTRDIQRMRKEADAAHGTAREKRLSYIFSFLGFTGITSLILSTDDFMRKSKTAPVDSANFALAVSYWFIPAVAIFMLIRAFGSASR